MESKAHGTNSYNLKVVVNETGLKPDTIRAWERRYGLPAPQRSKGGHRLYSRRDIEMLKWLVARQEEGLSISRAAHLWRQSIQEGDDPLLEESASAPLFDATAAYRLDELRDAWLAACKEFDEMGADTLLDQAFGLFPPEIVVERVLQSGLCRLGDEWYAGNASIQQEHFASGVVTRRLEAWLQSSPPPTRKQKILVGCAPQERHGISALVAALLLRRRGWHVAYLGEDVPLNQLEGTVHFCKATLMILTAQQLATAATLAEVWNRVRQYPFAYGGRAFIVYPQLKKFVPGYYLGDKLIDLPKQVEALLENGGEKTPATASILPQSPLLMRYQKRHRYIDAMMWEKGQSFNLPADVLLSANRAISQHISAALKFNDMELIYPTFQWVYGLLINRGLSKRMARSYFYLFETTLSQELGGDFTDLIAQFSAFSMQEDVVL